MFVTIDPLRERPTILVIDDDPLIGDIITRTLGEGGYGTVVVGDGRDAMDALWDVQPTLVILDCNLPGRTGMMLLEDIRAAAPDRDIPVLMLTGRAGNWNEGAAIRHGASRYMRKPFMPEDLIVTVAQLIRDRAAS